MAKIIEPPPKTERKAPDTRQVRRSVRRLESRSKVDGSAEYIHNLTLPGMLYGKIARSSVPHGKILKIDPAAALALEGVYAVITGEDIRRLIPDPYYGPAFHDQPILALEKVRYAGEPVAVALAVVSSADARKRPNDAPEVLPAQPVEPSGTSPQDTARFLAGMPVDPRSPLAPLTQTPVWQEHAAFFENAFAKLTHGKFARLHVWQDANLPDSKEPIPVVYYMFSGPDFLYLDQFFPNASTYILCGKESMGPPPEPLRMDIGYLSFALQNLENAMKSSLTATYFVTQDMKVDLQRQELLPQLGCERFGSSS